MKAIHMKYQPKDIKTKEKSKSPDSSDKDSKVIVVEAYSKGKITPEMEEILSKFKNNQQI